MARHRTLEPKAKEYIVQQIREQGGITTEEVMDLIRPHFQFDPLSAKEHLIRRQAHSIMGSIRDDVGARTCFACKDSNKNSLYVNIETTTDIKYALEIEKQLKNKLVGLSSSYQKARKKKKELEDQISMFDSEEAMNFYKEA